MGGSGWGFDRHSSELISLLTTKPFRQGLRRGNTESKGTKEAQDIMKLKKPGNAIFKIFQLLKHWFRPITASVHLLSFNTSYISSETDPEKSSANMGPSRFIISLSLSVLIV